MSDSVDDVCGLSEVIETEQVVEIMEEAQFLDLAASMETRGETLIASGGSFGSEHELLETEKGQLAGQKRKRGSVLIFALLYNPDAVAISGVILCFCYTVLHSVL